VHVTVRVRRHVWNLRSSRCYRRIGRCLERACGRLGLRVIEYAVLGNHVHFIVEADSTGSLARGMQGLSIRIAKSLNALMSSRGSVFADHYHSQLLVTPTQVVNAIAYVLGNHQHHYGAAGRDAFSSMSLPARLRQSRLAMPISWLLIIGWRKAARRSLARLTQIGWRRYRALT